MLTIMTHGMTVTRNNCDVMAVQPSMDQVYFKFVDQSEIIIPCKLDNRITRLLETVTAATAPNITIDFTNPQNLVSFVQP
jgi:hypothetical protein